MTEIEELRQKIDELTEKIDRLQRLLLGSPAPTYIPFLSPPLTGSPQPLYPGGPIPTTCGSALATRDTFGWNACEGGTDFSKTSGPNSP